ncbi:hypothetical protein [Mucilaginibacter gossypii]|uniref:Cthe-2314-like HEPN domain-containing protein n=1 Tax=Mucilaginibacter gossypii TaxID=551996 RepID=A0A1G8B813_9SPHI|nr:hypothetical protein [Mucilaginibacter gossypii]SDH29281.1 hypothetical protein SAMN05192573_108127 [Mucilaginibacter gossypii]
MNDYFDGLDQILEEITDKYEINNLISIQKHLEDSYWDKLARLSFFTKLFDEHHYHFLYEIQGLSSQIHFGIVNCILFRDKISLDKGRPNVYNHRYTFMIESTIHCIYSYWNRVGLVLNTYLKNPKDIKRTYFANVVPQLLTDYPALEQDKFYQWLCTVKTALDDLERNEFAHNNSLIMQNFLPKNAENGDFKALLAMPDLLLSHNKSIVDEIGNLVELVEKLETLI